MIHTVKDFIDFSIVNEAEVDVFLECSCFICDPVDVGNLISGSFAFSKSSWNTWKFLVHVLLKPSLENNFIHPCEESSIFFKLQLLDITNYKISLVLFFHHSNNFILIFTFFSTSDFCLPLNKIHFN